MASYTRWNSGRAVVKQGAHLVLSMDPAKRDGAMAAVVHPAPRNMGNMLESIVGVVRWRDHNEVIENGGLYQCMHAVALMLDKIDLDKLASFTVRVEGQFLSAGKPKAILGPAITAGIGMGVLVDVTARTELVLGETARYEILKPSEWRSCWSISGRRDRCKQLALQFSAPIFAAMGYTKPATDDEAEALLMALAPLGLFSRLPI
jgi:hypothetical protein